MSGIGPELPPHLLAKRKRKQEEEAENETAISSGAKRSPSTSDGEKRRRVVGPALPPAPLDERPVEPTEHVQENSDSEDEDEFGPALPASVEDEAGIRNDNSNSGINSTHVEGPLVEEKLRRDEWMTMPPKQDDLAARMDPTKQRPRAFNTGKGARGPNAHDDDSSAWHETPEQKQKRLADEMMGVAKASSTGPQRPPKGSHSAGMDDESRRILKDTKQTRGPSLLDQHKDSKGEKIEDDDPSKRAFDREKDMGSGMRIGHAQRKELLNKAANFSSKFAGGSYL